MYAWKEIGELTERNRKAYRFISSANVPIEVAYREALDIIKPGNTSLIIGTNAVTYYPLNNTLVREAIWITEPCTYIGRGIISVIDSATMLSKAPKIYTREDLYNLLASYRRSQHEKDI